MKLFPCRHTDLFGKPEVKYGSFLSSSQSKRITLVNLNNFVVK